MSEQCLLVLVAPPQLEESLVDFLLEQEEIAGFSVQEIDGSPAHGALTLAEQVTGRKKQIMFPTHAGCAQVRGLVTRVCETFRGAGRHY